MNKHQIQSVLSQKLTTGTECSGWSPSTLSVAHSCWVFSRIIEIWMIDDGGLWQI